MRVLVVDDDVSVRDLLTRELEAVAPDGVDGAASLSEGFAALADASYDCVVLDLSLPDGWGLDTLLQVRRRASAVPVVVVSGTQSEHFEAKSRRSGAAGFVQKGNMAPGVVAEAVLEAMRAARSGELGPDPIAELAAVGAHRSPVTAEIFGQIDIADAMSDRFDDLIEQYADLLELAVEQTAFVTTSSVSDHLRDLAQSLGSVGAGPRDVVKLHAQALERESGNRQGASAPAFMHEARLVVLELMGYLVNYYRLQTLGRGPTSGESE